jgi:hypothetical protein
MSNARYRPSRVARVVWVALTGLLLGALQAPGSQAETITWATGASGS